MEEANSKQMVPDDDADSRQVTNVCNCFCAIHDIFGQAKGCPNSNKSLDKYELSKVFNLDSICVRISRTIRMAALNGICSFVHEIVSCNISRELLNYLKNNDCYLHIYKYILCLYMINFHDLVPSILYIIIIFFRPTYTAFEFIECGYIRPLKLLTCIGFL